MLFRSQREGWPRRRSLGYDARQLSLKSMQIREGPKIHGTLRKCNHTTPRGCGKTSRAACVGPHVGCGQPGPYPMLDQATEWECVRPVKGVRGPFLHLPQISLPRDVRPSNQGPSRASHSAGTTTCMHTWPHMSLHGGDAWFGGWHKCRARSRRR